MTTFTRRIDAYPVGYTPADARRLDDAEVDDLLLRHRTFAEHWEVIRSVPRCLMDRRSGELFELSEGGSPPS